MEGAPSQLPMGVTPMERTDWDKYYNKPKGLTGFTRGLTQKKIVNCLRPYFQNSTFSVCELGGANSCVVEQLCNAFSISNYHVIDSNEYGLSLLNKINVKTKLTHELGDILELKELPQRKYDLVFSIGLIEHFNEEGTRNAIQTHLNFCKPDGILLLTFPTPTLLYKTIRMLAEKNGLWEFPDERPLTFAEVSGVLADSTDQLHQSINWMIGLTQGYIMVKKKS